MGYVHSSGLDGHEGMAQCSSGYLVQIQIAIALQMMKLAETIVINLPGGTSSASMQASQTQGATESWLCHCHHLCRQEQTPSAPADLLAGQPLVSRLWQKADRTVLQSLQQIQTQTWEGHVVSKAYG